MATLSWPCNGFRHILNLGARNVVSMVEVEIKASMPMALHEYAISASLQPKLHLCTIVVGSSALMVVDLGPLRCFAKKTIGEAFFMAQTKTAWSEFKKASRYIV